MDAWLRVVAGQDTGKTFRLTEETTTIGRTPVNAIQLHDERVSRRHLAVHWSEARHRFIDLQSANGVKLNEQRVSEDDLQDGDRLRVGDTILIYECRAGLVYPRDHSRPSEGKAGGAHPDTGRLDERVKLEEIFVPGATPDSADEIPFLFETQQDPSCLTPVSGDGEGGAATPVPAQPQAPLTGRGDGFHERLAGRFAIGARFEELLKPVTLMLFEDLGVERVAILRRSDSRFLSASFRQRPDVARMADAPPILRALIRASIADIAPQLVNTGELLPPLGGIREQAPFPAISVPVCVRDEVVAVLYVDNVLRIGRVYDRNDVRFVDTLATELGTALQ
jgi:hypothetical protein